MEKDIFDISFAHNGIQYNGWVNPSDKKNKDGVPVSFHVVLNGESFGYLSFNNNRWAINEHRPSELVDAAGNEIAKKYQL